MSKIAWKSFMRAAGNISAVLAVCAYIQLKTDLVYGAILRPNMFLLSTDASNVRQPSKQPSLSPPTGKLDVRKAELHESGGHCLRKC